jgi:hypothetical protein
MPPANANLPIQTRQPQTGAPFDRLPEPLHATRVAIDRKLIASMPSTVSGEIVIESSSGDHAMLSRLSSARKANPTLLGDLPIVVLSRGLNSSLEQSAAHAEISRLSRNSRHLVVAESYHEIHLSHPNAVVAAIGDVVAAVRAKVPLR